MKERKKKKLFLADKDIDSHLVQLTKTGSLSRVKENKVSEKLAKYVIKKCEKRNLKISYDVTYGGFPEEIRYSEFFAGFGGIQLGACDGKMVRRMYNRPFNDEAIIDHADMLDLRENVLHDKYIVHSYDAPLPESIVIMPGSNILEDVVDKEQLNAAVLLGAKVKLHPLTNKQHKKFLIEQYGEERVLPNKYSGYKCMLGANVVYTTGASELGLYAALLGKRVISISTGCPKGGYADAFARIIHSPDQGYELNYLIHNPASGIILPQMEDWKDRIDVWFDIHEEMLKDHDEVEIPNLSRWNYGG